MGFQPNLSRDKRIVRGEGDSVFLFSAAVLFTKELQITSSLHPLHLQPNQRECSPQTLDLIIFLNSVSKLAPTPWYKHPSQQFSKCGPSPENLLERHILVPPQTHWTSNTWGGAQPSGCSLALQVSLMQVWNHCPALYLHSAYCSLRSFVRLFKSLIYVSSSLVGMEDAWKLGTYLSCSGLCIFRGLE